jgi:hypothetical protein
MFLRAGPFQADVISNANTNPSANKKTHRISSSQFTISFTVPFVGGRSLLAIYTLGPTWPYLCVVSGALKGIDAYIGLIHTGGTVAGPLSNEKVGNRMVGQGLELVPPAFRVLPAKGGSRGGRGGEGGVAGI